MATSQNGWSVIESYGPPALTGNIEIPGTGGVKLLGGVRVGDAATVLLWVASQFHQRVDPLRQDLGQWGYNHRPIRGTSSGFSNHAAGTAIDLNASRYPMGSRNMSPAQRAACRAIAGEAGVIRWGGDWSGSGVDEMHFEIQGSAAAVTAAAARLGKTAPTPPAPQPTPTPSPGTPTLAPTSSTESEDPDMFYAFDAKFACWWAITPDLKSRSFFLNSDKDSLVSSWAALGLKAHHISLSQTTLDRIPETKG